MKYHLISALLLVTAIVLYLVGFSGGGVALLALGAACEVWFWIRLVRGRAHRRSHA